MTSLSPATVAEIERSRAEMEQHIAAGWARIRSTYQAEEPRQRTTPERMWSRSVDAIVKALASVAPPPCDDCSLRQRCASLQLACDAFAVYVSGAQPRKRKGLPSAQIYADVFRATDHDTITTPLCSVAGCDRPVAHRSLCSRHYSRAWRAGRKAVANATPLTHKSRVARAAREFTISGSL